MTDDLPAADNFRSRGFIGRAEYVIHYLQLALAGIVGFLAIGVFFCVSANVFGRYVLDSSYDWAEGMSRYLFIWMAFLGAGVGCLRNKNIAITFVKDAVPRSIAHVFELIKIVVIYGVCVLIFVSYHKIASGFVSRTPLLGIPKTELYVAMVVMAVLMAIANTMDLLRLVAVFRRSE